FFKAIPDDYLVLLVAEFFLDDSLCSRDDWIPGHDRYLSSVIFNPFKNLVNSLQKLFRLRPVRGAWVIPPSWLPRINKRKQIPKRFVLTQYVKSSRKTKQRPKVMRVQQKGRLFSCQPCFQLFQMQAIPLPHQLLFKQT